MVGLDDHLKDPLYANWVRNIFALNIVNSVLQPYVYGEVVKLHKSIIRRCQARITCGSCSLEQVPRCPNNFCNFIKDEIRKNHRYGNPSFDNTNASHWKSDAWEVAKCFMPKDYRECTSSNADFSATVNIVINCKAFDNLVLCNLNFRRNIFSKSRKLRNDLMHSYKLKVSECDIQRNLALLMRILNDIKDKPTSFIEALDKIMQLNAGRLKITLEDVLDARTQFLLENGLTKEFVNEQIAKLRQEIKEGASIWKVSQHRLIDNFVKGSKYALVKIMESHIDKVKPERCPTQTWNFSKFLDSIEGHPDILLLHQRHKLVLYPDDGVTADIHDLDLFLLCHILSIEPSVLLDNNLKAYIGELKHIRDKILGNPPNIAVTDLEEIVKCLKEPLKTEMLNIYHSEGITDGALKLQFELTSWQQNEDTMEHKQIEDKALKQMKKQIERLQSNRAQDRRESKELCEVFLKMMKWQALHPEDQEQIDQLIQAVERLRNRLDNEEDIDSFDATAKIQIRETDREQEDLVQSNMTSEDLNDNIAHAGGGISHLQEELDFEFVKIVKGSIILKVTCKSVKDVIRFWDSCMDGSAVKAMSKIRDDYRKHFGCGSLEFAIVLTKNEVQRCMNHLVEKMSSRLLDDNTVKEIQAQVAMLQTEPVKKMSPGLLKENTAQEIQAKVAMLQSVPGLRSPKKFLLRRVSTMDIEGSLTVDSADEDHDEAIEGLAQHLKDQEYANWVKNTLAMKFTLNALKPYVCEELSAIQASITSKGSPGGSECPNDVRNNFMKEIKDRNRLPKPSFSNTNSKRWTTDAWEIAKCFMPPIEGYKNCTQSDADFSAVINVIINCKHFDTLVSCNLNQNGNMFCEARTMRNMLMHSDSLKVSEANLQENLDLLIRLLSCFNDTPPDFSKAVEQIQKLKTGALKVTMKNVVDAREQAALAFWEEMDKEKEEIRGYVKLQIAALKKEIKTATTTWKAQQHRLISNFIKGCKRSLIRLVKSESERVKPERYPQQKWNFEEFLNKIELFPDVRDLLGRHKRYLYPEDGSPSDINKWDIFLLCHILSVEISAERPNDLVNFVKELQATRNNILENPDSIGKKDLEELSDFLAERLGTESKSIFADEDITEDALQLQSVLKSWQQNEDNMECKQIGIKALEETKIQAKRIDGVESKQAEDRKKIDDMSERVGKIINQFAKSQNQMEELQEEIRKLNSGGNMAEGNGNLLEARAEIKPINVDPEEKHQIQNNITSENKDENIAIANGGLVYFQEQTKFEPVQTNKGSIILKVPCKSIKELIRFWDICMDGTAVRALSKIRDDYRRILGCQTLEFDIVLSKKEVHRCMNHLVDRISSRSLDQSILKEVRAKVAKLEAVSAMEVALSEVTMRQSQDEEMKPATVEDSSEEMGESNLDADVLQGKGKEISKEAPWLSLLADIETAEEHSFRACGPERVNKDSQPGAPSKLPLRTDLKHGDEEATRLAKFLRQMAESFEEGSISVVKPYLYELTKHSREKNQKAFDESVIRFTEAASFKGGISVSLIKQVHRGFHMILDEPEFGDLVVAKVGAIEKEERSIAGEASRVGKSSWPTDVKSTVIIAEDIQVVGTKTPTSQSDLKPEIKSSFETESSKEKQPGYTKVSSGMLQGYKPEPSKIDEYTSKLKLDTTEEDVAKIGPSESS